MRTTIIPAQITTVEDKIAGNLSVNQMAILLIPIFFGVFVFALIPPTMHLVFYKLPPLLLISAVCLFLSLRIKDKVMFSWLIILLLYNLRPRYYVFNKNDNYLRDILEQNEKKTEEIVKKITRRELTFPARKFGVRELKRFEFFIKNPKYSFSLKPGKKGGLYVSISEIKT